MKGLVFAALAVCSFAAYAQDAGKAPQAAPAFDNTKLCMYGQNFYTEGAHIKATDGARLICQKEDRVIEDNDPVPLHWDTIGDVRTMR